MIPWLADIEVLRFRKRVKSMTMGAQAAIIERSDEQPEHQNKGIFNRMGQFAIQYLKENDYALSYGFPAPMSRSGFLKQGWRIVAETETIFRAVHPQKLISYKLRSKLLVSGLYYQLPYP